MDRASYASSRIRGVIALASAFQAAGMLVASSALHVPSFSLCSLVIHELDDAYMARSAKPFAFGTPKIGSRLCVFGERSGPERPFRLDRGWDFLPYSIAQPSAGPKTAQVEAPVALQPVRDRSLVGAGQLAPLATGKAFMATAPCRQPEFLE